MNRNWIMITLGIVVVLAVVLLTVHLHNESEKEVLSQFKERQFLHALHAASQIETFFWSYTQRLRALSSFRLPQEGLKEIRAEIEAHHKQMENNYGEVISLYDETGATVKSTDRTATGLNYGQCDFFTWAKKRENKGGVFVSPFYRIEEERLGRPKSDLRPGNAGNFPPDSLKLFLSTPLYQDTSNAKSPEEKDKFVGVLSITIDLEEFIDKKLKTFKTDLYQLWIIEEKGDLLFQSEHPEMALRNIYLKNESCNPCHLSFDYTEKILKEKRGTVDYALRNGPKKLAAFAPMKFENLNWVVVVNSVYDKVIAFHDKNFRDHLWLLGIVVFSLIGGVALFHRNYRFTVKAEEEAKHWQEIIAERRKAEETLRKSEERYRMLVDTMNDGLAVEDENGLMVYCNDRFFNMVGYSRDELLGHPVNDLIDEGRQNSLIKQMNRRGKGEHEVHEIVLKRKDGQKIFVIMSPMPIFSEDGQFKGHSVVITDITERKRTEEVLKESERRLRLLSSQLLTAQETERKRISRELHDELGGSLAVFKLRLNFINRNLQKDQVLVKKECEDSLEYIDQVIENVHRLSWDLTPAILEDLGLSAALRWLVKNFVKHYNVPVKLDLTDIDPLFSREAQMIIYRLFQEAFTNIGKHAQTQTVWAVIKNQDTQVTFSIEDDGKGFDLMRTLSKNGVERGLGLAIMGERVRMLGGTFDLWSQEGNGTRITFVIPVKKGEIL